MNDARLFVYVAIKKRNACLCVYVYLITMTHYTEEFLNAADPFRSLTLTQTDAHTLPHTPLMMCFYRRWELNLHFTPCLFLEFLTVSLDLSSGDLRDPVLGWRGMTARLLISNCVSVCACVRVLTGWKNSGSLSSPLSGSEGPQWSCGGWRTNTISQCALSWGTSAKRLCCFSHKWPFSLLLWIFVDSLGRLRNIVRGLAPHG